ncbi:hypothetical protein B0T20DRAFT_356900 [Sordaria brevicollis]|uniref:Uncharacterized protein n=1 Tax=Sordaria brevicollis TaxID=83679 RepID=A0AAE0PCK5_SORBR|nr:hypothetical protein B0T20DRAFT_356900 [Sordaria brevicollis]
MAKTLFGEDRFVGFDSWDISLWAGKVIVDTSWKAEKSPRVGISVFNRLRMLDRQALVFSRPLSHEVSDGDDMGTMTHSPSSSKLDSDAVGEGAAKRGILTPEAR